MNPTIPKDIGEKIRKFVETAEALKSGKATYFSITRLTSLKTLCKAPEVASHFVFFLAERTQEKAESRPYPSHLTKEDWERCKELISEAIHLMRAHLERPTEETLSALRTLLLKVAVVQTYTGERVWGREIRSIRSSEVLIVEDALHCMLNPHAAGELAYRAARDYTEEYNPRYGTGLIPESVPMLEDIIRFWTGHAERMESSHSLSDTSESPGKTRRRRKPPRKISKEETVRIFKVTALGSFEHRYPNVTAWVRG